MKNLLIKEMVEKVNEFVKDDYKWSTERFITNKDNIVGYEILETEFGKMLVTQEKNYEDKIVTIDGIDYNIRADYSSIETLTNLKYPLKPIQVVEINYYMITSLGVTRVYHKDSFEKGDITYLKISALTLSKQSTNAKYCTLDESTIYLQDNSILIKLSEKCWALKLEKQLKEMLDTIDFKDYEGFQIGRTSGLYEINELAERVLYTQLSNMGLKDNSIGEI